MTAAVGVLLGLMVGAALLLLLAGLTPHTSSPTSGRPVRSSQRGWAQLTRRPTGSAGRRRDLVWAGLVGVGVVGYVVSGWIVLIVLVPACGIALPWLLSNPNSLAIARTSATSGEASRMRRTLPPAEPVAPKRRILSGRGGEGMRRIVAWARNASRTENESAVPSKGAEVLPMS